MRKPPGPSGPNPFWASDGLIQLGQPCRVPGGAFPAELVALTADPAGQRGTFAGAPGFTKCHGCLMTLRRRTREFHVWFHFPFSGEEQKTGNSYTFFHGNF